MSYKWVELAGGLVRAKCVKDNEIMKWALELRPEYGKTINKHTREYHAHPVVYNGRVIQVWKCGTCKQTVVK